MKSYCSRSSIAGFSLILTNLFPASAAVKMPCIFGDHMVLQQGIGIPVWGWAAPGEKITVSFGAQTETTITDRSGNWKVNLAPIATAPTAFGQTLTIAGTNTFTFQDVVAGDVWLASGQSNMDYGLGLLDNASTEVPKANEPMLRIFCVLKLGSTTPLKETEPPSPDSMLGKWEICTPETVMKVNSWNGFSAVGYYFGREIQHSLGYPVGVIDATWGGTPSQAWTSLEGLQKYPKLAHYVDDHQKIIANYPQALAAFPKVNSDYLAAKKQWDGEVGDAYHAKMDAWQKLVADAHAKGLVPPPNPGPPSRPEPQAPIPPDGGPDSPCNLYNGMIASLVPYPLKGAIWYQGESNAGSPSSGEEYATLFPAMISDWREKWGQGDFPFLFVQLASFGDPAQTPSQDTWPYLREAQAKTLSLPHTGMAVSIDIGDPYNIHPSDKLDVGLRLALAAKHVAYGQDLVYSGPIFDHMEVQESKIILSFKDQGAGLKFGPAPWVSRDIPVPPPPTELTGFGIAGNDKKFVWAHAVIAGDKVIVSNKNVPAPVAVRYGWGNTPPVDLYNKEGLPASPFRTDHWD